MCGIAGVYNFGSSRPVGRRELEEMNSTMRHRGPDDGGCHLDGELGLAMRRLAIIDVAGGRQPLHNEDESVWAVVNGEIYNFPQLRAELEGKGHVFYTRSDAEVLVHLYEEHGQDLAERLEGMFAFAVWDAKERRLVLGRDHLGIKPLVYHLSAGRIVFASEIKTIHRLAPKSELDLEALSNYLSFLYIPSPNTIYSDIKRLLPGHCMIVDRGGVKIKRYWRLTFDIDPNRSEAETLDRLEELLKETVQSHLMSDVPLGAFLSSGLDSSLVVSFMSELVSEPVKTFTVGFPERSFDERPEAGMIARALKTDHTDLVMRPEPEVMIRTLLEYFDEPFADYGAIPLYYVSELARRGVTVALTGDGGDEFFGGYQTYFAPTIRDLYAKVPAGMRRKVIDRLVAALPTSFSRVSFDFMAKRFVSGVDLPYLEGHFHWKAVFDADEKTTLFRGGLAGGPPADVSLERYRELFASASEADLKNRLMYVDANHFLTDCHLTKADRMSMAHGLEVRVPLCDRRVAEFAATIPGEMKVRTLATKRLFRKLAKRRLPPQIGSLRKKGFSPPVALWLKNELADFTRQVLSEENLRQIGMFDSAYVQGLIDEHQAQRRDNNRKLWALLVFVVWWHEFYRRRE